MTRRTAELPWIRRGRIHRAALDGGTVCGRARRKAATAVTDSNEAVTCAKCRGMVRLVELSLTAKAKAKTRTA